MTLPSTGDIWSAVLEPTLQPLAVRYWQIAEVLIQDYRDANGVPKNWSASAVGLGNAGLFTPFAVDGQTRDDLLITGPEPNQGFYHLGELKEDTIGITPEITVQQTPTAQSVRSVREVLTKLDDTVNFTPIEATPLVDALRYEQPLAGGLQDVGTAGYQLGRGVTDQLIERTIVLLGYDGDGNVRGEIFPRCMTNKKGKTELQRKNPESLELTYTVLPDPYTGHTMWICRDGSNWRALGGAPVIGTITATPVTGTKVTLAFPLSGTDTATATFSATKTTGGTTTTLTLSGTPSVVGGVVTLTGTGLTAATSYTATVTVTGDNGATASATSSSFTAIA